VRRRKSPRPRACLAERLAAGSRLVYVGVGTAGRVAALEAAECVPLFGLPPSLVVPVLAGGPHALARTVEISQDSRREAEQRMRKAAVGPGDVVCAVADAGNLGVSARGHRIRTLPARPRGARVVRAAALAEDGGGSPTS
jgi:N-acetylmuramic acid 6-phosphate (MurNAc-6-P) etherase